jgi:hypothetical protein
MLTVTDNFPDVARAFAGLESDIRNKAMASALNKTMDQGRTLLSREITARYVVTSAYVKQRLRVRGASARAGQLRLEASLIGGDGKARSANVIAFVERRTTFAQAKKRRQAGTLNQLHLKIKKGSAAKPLKGAFIGNKGRTVFQRVGKARLPIKPVQTIDVGQMMMSRAVEAKIHAFAQKKFPELFEHEVLFYTAKALGRG